METTQLNVKLLSKTAQLPKCGSEGAAGLDLYADLGDPSAQMTMYPHGKVLIPLNIAIEVPFGYYGRIAPRSSLAMKHIDVGAGVVDSDYRGPVGVVLFNLSHVLPFTISHGDRVAQLILEKISLPKVCEVLELEDTQRGAGGFGSTGK
jgi:dUTP pyrophosphatase